MYKGAFSMDSTPALSALLEAQKIAFGPMAFQAVRLLRNYGILECLDKNHNRRATSIAALQEQLNLSAYALKLLLRAGLAAQVVKLQGDDYALTAVGALLLRDEMTRVNMDFMHDVCYRAAFHLDEAITTASPSGLKELSQAATVYEGLAELEPAVLQSWLAYDHLYSDGAFKAASMIVFSQQVDSLLDVGGNTGKWSRYCLAQRPELKIGLFDLPRQVGLARRSLVDLADRCQIDFHEGDILSPHTRLPHGYQIIWMSQFLDCFSAEQIGDILRKAHEALPDGGTLYILEVFSDRQSYDVGSYVVNMSSPYFTCVANGNSFFYAYEDFQPLLSEAGFCISRCYDDLGLGHTLLECKKAQ
jgi:hypothetical protein